MKRYYATDEQLISVADAIRAKAGTSAGLSFPDGFVSGIESIPSGGIDYEIKTVEVSYTFPSLITISAGSSEEVVLTGTIPDDIALTDIIKMGVIESTYHTIGLVFYTKGGSYAPRVNSPDDIRTSVFLINKGSTNVVIPSGIKITTTLSYYAYPST